MKKIIVFIAVVLLTGAMLLMIDIVNRKAVEDEKSMNNFFNSIYLQEVEELEPGEELENIYYDNINSSSSYNSTFYSRVKVLETKEVYEHFLESKEEYFQMINEEAPVMYSDMVDSSKQKKADLNNQVNILLNEINGLPDGEAPEADEDCIIFCSTTTDKEHYQNEIEDIKEDIDEVQFNSELQTTEVKDDSTLMNLFDEFSYMDDIQETLDGIQTDIEDLQEDVDNYEK